jgi:hypothetical protein
MQGTQSIHAGRSIFIFGLSGAGCALVLFWGGDRWKIAEAVIAFCMQDQVRVIGYNATTEGEACMAATVWATRIEELRHNPDWPREDATLATGQSMELGWHNVEYRLDAYQPTIEMLAFLSPDIDSELTRHGPVAIHANLVPDGPTCVRVYAGSALSTVNCVSRRSGSYESWDLCTF